MSTLQVKRQAQKKAPLAHFLDNGLDTASGHELVAVSEQRRESEQKEETEAEMCLGREELTRYLASEQFSGPHSSNNMCAKSLSHVLLFMTLWTVAHQAPLSMEFPRQEY